MQRTDKILLFIIPLIVTFFFTCSRKDDREFPGVSIIVGNAELVRNDAVMPLKNDHYLRPGDTLRVGSDSKVKLHLLGGTLWYMGKGSELIFDEPVPIDGNKRRLMARLTSGQMHIVKKNETAGEIGITTPNWKIRITAADVTIDAGVPGRVMLLNGFATYAHPERGPETVLPVCNTLITNVNKESEELQPINLSEITDLKSWVGTTIIDDALAKSSCFLNYESVVQSTKIYNNSPEWRRLPNETVMSGNYTVIDTVEAVDPEQETVIYKLLKGPSGMKLDSMSGILTYMALYDSNYSVSLAAYDPEGKACTASVAITIFSGNILRIVAPVKIEPGIPFTINAIVDQRFQTGRLLYRFDLDGDGWFEVPRNGKYGRSSMVRNHVIKEEGVYKIKIEAKDENGKTISSTKRIISNLPPTAALIITPSTATVGTPVVFDVSGSSDTRNGTVPLRVRFDITGDGIWDIPKDGSTMKVDSCIYKFEEAGKYRVVAQLNDMDGASATATADVVIKKRLDGGVINGVDTVNVNDSVHFTCNAGDVDVTITDYAWDMTGKGSFDRVTRIPVIAVTYPHEGTFTVQCRITDENKRQSVVLGKIVVINNETVVDAGGKYEAGVNEELILRGTGRDNDNRIISLSWDFNGDGVIDTVLKTVSDVVHRYTNAGVYKAVFTVTTDDKKGGSDTALVNITNNPPTVDAGADIVSVKNRKIGLSGTGHDKDGSIVMYEWDFNGDGTFDWNSKDNGNVEHQFTEYTNAILRVRDSDGATSSDTLRIIICPEGMHTVKTGKFCIDIYEYPNTNRTVPKTNVTYEEAEAACKRLGKRLCTSEEWKMVCSDHKKGWPYPYGKRYSESKCNTLGNPRIKNSIAASGEFIDCKTDGGVYDMSGNVAEWTAGSNSEFSVYGGSWQNGEQGSSCVSKIKLQKSKGYFYAGFRCCK